MVALNRFEGYPRHRWPLPTDPSGPPMAYPEPMPTYMPPMTPPATTAPPAAPTDTAYPPTGFQEPQQAPEVSPEDAEFEREMEDEAAETQAIKKIEKKTAWNEHRSKYLSSLYKTKVQLRKLKEELQEAEAHKAPTTYEEYKALKRAPSGAEVLSPDFDLEGYIIAGGEPEELERIRKEEADRVTLEKYAPQYVAPFQDLTFEEGRELVGRQREHREATMAPIREKLASIRERRKELKRAKRPPTWQDIFEQEKTVAEIKAPQPKQYQPGIIENTTTGEQQPYTWGQPIPPGFKIVKEASTVVNIGSKPASPGERTKIAEKRAALDALDNLRALYNESFVGPITGRVAPTQSLLEMTSEQQDNFMAATSAFKNAIIKEITGAQMSEVEAKRIMKQIPDITDPPQRWMAKWQQTRKNVEYVHGRYLEILGQSGLAVPGETNVDISQISDEELKRIAGIE